VVDRPAKAHHDLGAGTVPPRRERCREEHEAQRRVVLDLRGRDVAQHASVADRYRYPFLKGLRHRPFVERPHVGLLDD
jgi:hypothetical protein